MGDTEEGVDRAVSCVLFSHPVYVIQGTLSSPGPWQPFELTFSHELVGSFNVQVHQI